MNRGTAANVDIIRDSPRWPRAGLDAEIRRAVEAALEVSGVRLNRNAEISLLLADDARARDLNRAWRGLDQPTNVLSFPAGSPGALADAPHLGDVVLAFETIAAEAASADKKLADHVLHLVVHGVLHLLGHDHIDPAEAAAMEALEIRALARLGIADPYEERPQTAAGRARA